jgi:type IV pilus assembly protein PilN
MAKINLLPWREELRKQRRQDFFAAMGLGVIFAIITLVVVHTYMSSLTSYQERRNKLLQNEITLLDKKLGDISTIEEKKSKLLAKIDLLQKLQGSRPEIVHLFDELPKIVPEGVLFTKFTQIGTDLTFEGKSQSNARVSALMKNIESSSWLSLPSLTIIKAVDKDNPDALSDFTLRAKQGKQVAAPLADTSVKSSKPSAAAAKPKGK